MGMLTFVYRHAPHGDTTAGGVTSKADRILVIGIDGPFKPDPGEVYLVIKKRGDYVYAVPAVDGRELDPPGMVGPMFGGNFVYTSDSRFRRVSPGPIAVHDRWETPEANDALSR